MASVVPRPWWRLLEIRNEGGRKNSEVVFSTSDVEKFSSEVEFSISELFCFRPFSLFFSTDGRPFRGRSAVHDAYRRFAVAARRLTLRLLGVVPFGDGNSCCFPFVAENVLPCIILMGNDR